MFPYNNTRYIFDDSVAEAEIHGVHLTFDGGVNLEMNQRPPAELGYEDGPWKGPGPPLLGAADLLQVQTENPPSAD